MMERVRNFIKKSRFALIGGVFALAVVGAGTAAFIQPTMSAPTAAAFSCDPVNVINCGLNGSTLNGYVSSFKDYYNKGTDGRYADLKADYRWAGATDASVAAMDSSNTKMGTLYRNGDIKVGDQVVAHDSWISARFGQGQQGFYKVPNTVNIYARKTTTSMAEPTAPVIVHYDQYGMVDFAVMITCGNSVKTTPVPTKPQLNCDLLTYKVLPGHEREYTFTATATAKYTTITSYVFDFGDGHSFTRNTSAETAQVIHGYAHPDTTYHASVVVNSTRQSGVTSPACHVTIHTPAVPQLACVDLQAAPIKGQDLGYNFSATASADHTTITKYVFDFGDGSSKTINTSKSTAQTSHTYGDYNHQYTAKVTVYSKDFPNGVSGPRCQTTFTTPKKPHAPRLACVSLTPNAVSGQANTYTFTATASADHTTITKYVFDFGDGNNQTVNTDKESATSTAHTYANNTQSYTAMVTVYGKDFPKGVTAPTCQTTIPAQVCQPGTPTTNSNNQCTTPTPTPVQPCQPGTPTSNSSSTCQLPNTGPGNVIGFLGATSVAGGLLHRFFLRRKYIG